MTTTIIAIAATAIVVALVIYILLNFNSRAVQQKHLADKFDTVSALKDQLQLQTLLSNASDKQTKAIADSLNSAFGISTVTADNAAIFIDGAATANARVVKSTEQTLKNML